LIVGLEKLSFEPAREADYAARFLNKGGDRQNSDGIQRATGHDLLGSLSLSNQVIRSLNKAQPKLCERG
jgi:hypothetical protein